MAVIFPFEAEFYRTWQVPVSFVGHPLLDHASLARSTDPQGAAAAPSASCRDRATVRSPATCPLCFRRPQSWPLGGRSAFSGFPCPRRQQQVADSAMAAAGSGPHVEKVNGGMDRILSESRMAMAVSGTVTLETAISGMPMVIIYRVSPVSYRLGRALIRVKSIGLVNLIAGRKIVPELVQKTPIRPPSPAWSIRCWPITGGWKRYAANFWISAAYWAARGLRRGWPISP